MSEVEQLARDHALFAPPLVRVDQRGCVARGAREPGGGLERAIGAARVLHAREQEAGIALKRGGHGADRPRRQGTGRRRDARLGERDFVGAGERRRAQRRRGPFGVEQPVGAIFMVGARQRRREILQHRAFRPGVEIALAPQRAHDSRRLVAPPRVERGARGGELAGGRARRIAREQRGDDRRRGALGIEMGLLLSPDPVVAGPLRMGRGESREAPIVGPRGQAQRHPFQRGALERIGRLASERVAPRLVALPIERRRRGETARIDARSGFRSERRRRSGLRGGQSLGLDAAGRRRVDGEGERGRAGQSCCRVGSSSRSIVSRAQSHQEERAQSCRRRGETNDDHGNGLGGNCAPALLSNG